MNFIYKMILAVNIYDGIGKDGGMPWNMREDLKYFKEYTKDCFIVMGRKTFDSFPGLLPNRTHIVISSTPISAKGDVVWCKSIEEVDIYIERENSGRIQLPRDVVYIGGASIYNNKDLIDRCDEVSITTIQSHAICDTFVSVPVLTDNRTISNTYAIAEDANNDHDAFIEVWSRT